MASRNSNTTSSNPALRPLWSTKCEYCRMTPLGMLCKLAEGATHTQSAITYGTCVATECTCDQINPPVMHCEYCWTKYETKKRENNFRTFPTPAVQTAETSSLSTAMANMSLDSWDTQGDQPMGNADANESQTPQPDANPFRQESKRNPLNESTDDMDLD